MKKIILFLFIDIYVFASAVDGRFSYQDYLDFGANKGRFEAGATNIIITSKDGSKTVNIPIMPDFSAANGFGDYDSRLSGELTNIGKNKAVTAAHMIKSSSDPKLIKQGQVLTFGGVHSRITSTSNNFENYTQCNGDGICENKNDFVVIRMSKVNVNTTAKLNGFEFFDENGNDLWTKACSSDRFTDNNKGCQQKEVGRKAFLSWAKNNNVLFARSGSGTQKIVENKNEKDPIFESFGQNPYDMTDNEKLSFISASNEYFTGSFVNADYEKGANEFIGIGFNEKSKSTNMRADFSNIALQGDSGSALYVFNPNNNAWELVGVTSFTQCSKPGDPNSNEIQYCQTHNFAPINTHEITKFENDTSIKLSEYSLLTLNQNQLFWHSVMNGNKTIYDFQPSVDDRTKDMQNDKDLIVSKNLSIDIDDGVDFIDLRSSAFFVDKNITLDFSNSQNAKIIHGGFDIASGGIVNYSGITPKDDVLHKSGDGTLNILKASSEGGFAMGGGVTKIDKNIKQAPFKSIYINGGKIYFTDLGQIDGSVQGGLFLNNGEIIFENITNLDIYNLQANKNTKLSSSTPMNFNMELSLANNETFGIIHSNIQGNIAINHTAKKDNIFIYDGGFDINSLSISNQNHIVLSGHENAHNIPQELQSHLNPDTFIQNRQYVLNDLNINNAKLDIAGSTDLFAQNINVKNGGMLKIGTNDFYFDKKDGENISVSAPNSYGGIKDVKQYQTKIEKRTQMPVNIVFNAKNINLDNSTLEIFQGGALNTQNLTLNNATIDAKINTQNLNAQNTTFVFKDNGDLIKSSISTTGTNNILRFLPDFLQNACEKVLVADLANAVDLTSYFQYDCGVLSICKPNLISQADGQNLKWYLSKISNDESEEEKPLQPSEKPSEGLPSETPDKNPKPELPDQSKPEDDLNPKPDKNPETPSKIPETKPLDPNPTNNPSNKETPGHYKEYFFVKENTKAIKTAENSLNQVFFGYVLEWNNMQKRMGELRDNLNGAGIWLRNFGGANSYKNTPSTKYFETQFGIDKQNVYQNGLINYTGIVFGMSHYKMRNPQTSGGLNGLSVGLYSSFLFDNGFYFDIVGKYLEYKNNFQINLINGASKNINLIADNKNFSAIASAEMGYRMLFSNEFYIEPSLEIIGGYVSEQKISNEQEYIFLEMKAFSPLSLKSMLNFGLKGDGFGFRVGGGLATDLLPNGDKTIRDLNVIRNIKGVKDKRILSAISFHKELWNDARMSFEIEKTFGGDMNIDWAANLTIRQSF